MVGRSTVKYKDRTDEECAHLQERIEELEELNRSLKAQEGWYRQLVENTTEGIWTVDRDWKTSYVNDALARMLGYAPAEMMGRPLITFFSQDEQSVMREHMVARERGVRECFVIPLPRKDGSVLTARLSTSPLLDEGGRFSGSMAFVSDVSADAKAMEEARQSAMDARRRAEEVEALMDVVPAAIWVTHDPGCSEMISNQTANDLYENVRGHQRPLSQSCEDWNASRRFFMDGRETAPRDLPLQRAAFEGVEQRNVEIETILPSGRRVVTLTNARPLYDEKGRIRGSIASSVDITERNKADEALRESEERFRRLSDATFEGIVVHSNGTILDLNYACLEQTGYTRDELIGRSILDFFTEDSQGLIQRAVHQPVVEAYEAHLIRKDGEVRTVLIKGRTMDYQGKDARVATLVDVTDLVRAREQIEELMARKELERVRLQTVLDTLPVAVVIIEPSGKVAQSNKRAKEIWGSITRLDPTSMSDYRQLKGWWSDTGIPLKAEDWTVARAMRDRRTIIGDLIDIERFSGGRGSIINSAAPIIEDNEVVGGVIVTDDITKQRELEHEAIAAKERAELYIDLLSHDISNMNAAALGYLQMVEEARSLDADTVKRLAKCRGAMEDISGLIEKVKKIQSIEGAGSRRGISDLGWIIEDVIRSFSDLPGKEVSIHYEPQLKRMVVASELLSDAFSNLIDNAIKHSRGPVNIWVSIGRTFDQGREYYRVTVEDDGLGIPDEAKGKMFSRLQRGKTKASGSGLGLYLVRSLVEDFQGRVWVEDRVPGDHTKGAKCVVLLPVAHEPEGRLKRDE